MAAFLPKLTDELIQFIQKQPVFFVGTAAATGRINVSPKGMDTFRVLSPTLVGYLDLTGSGSETSAHILASQRITIMFTSFDAKPLILRLYGQGEVVALNSPRAHELDAHFPNLPGSRQIILLHLDSLQTSCGYAVPRFGKPEERQKLIEWAEAKGEPALSDYRKQKNAKSIDGLPTGVHS